MPEFFSSEVTKTVSDSLMEGRASSLSAVTTLSASSVIRLWRNSRSSSFCRASVPNMKIVCAIPILPAVLARTREYKKSAHQTEAKSRAVFMPEFDRGYTRGLWPHLLNFRDFLSGTGRIQAAFCSGKSTSSHSDRPLQRRHLGKLASSASMTSSPQQSDTYRPDSFTS